MKSLWNLRVYKQFKEGEGKAAYGTKSKKWFIRYRILGTKTIQWIDFEEFIGKLPQFD